LDQPSSYNLYIQERVYIDFFLLRFLVIYYKVKSIHSKLKEQGGPVSFAILVKDVLREAGF